MNGCNTTRMTLELVGFTNCSFSKTPVSDNEAKNSNSLFIVLTLITPAACLLSVLAAFVLTRQGMHRLGAMRINLLTLTLSEACLSAFVFVSSVAVLAETSTGDLHPTYHVIILLIAFFATNLCICIRNWIITYIALARCIAIVRPMASRRLYTHLFHPRSMMFCTLVCLVIITILSVFRMFEAQMCICLNVEGNSRIQMKSNTALIRNTFFTVQTGLPVLIVFFTTILMVTVFCRKRTFNSETERCFTSNRKLENVSHLNASIRPTTNSVIAGRMEGSHQSASVGSAQNVVRAQNHLRATRMITLLATAFIALEGPILMCILFQHQLGAAFNQVQKALKIFIVVDSCVNVIIYVVMYRRFREEALRVWTVVKGYLLKVCSKVR